MMVRAIFQEGQIRLLDPFPEGWREGQELAVGTIDEGDADAMVDQESIRRWHQERLTLSADLTENDDRQMQVALEEQRQVGKDSLLREQGTI